MASLGIGVLSWKAPETLKITLASHDAGGFAGLFSERLVLLQESDPNSRAVVADHGYTAENLSENLGILGGFDALARAMQCDSVLITENDFPLVETADVAAVQIRRAHALIQAGEADIVLMRSRSKPGTPFDIGDKYPRFYPKQDASPSQRLAAAVRRIVRPGKARRLLARSTCLREDAVRVAGFANTDLGDGFHLTSSKYLPWTNNPFMVRRAFLVDTILSFAKNAQTNRRVNGFKNLEIELNCAWWRDNQFKIVHAPGLFTHGRVGDRGY